MKKNLCLAGILLFSFTFLSAESPEATGGVMFSNIAIRQYGIKKWMPSHPKLGNLDVDVQMKAGAIEKGITIDTKLEAAIALWLASPVKIQALPQNALGAKRLCFDLFTKMAENPGAELKYKQGIILVLKEAKNKYGVSVSNSDVTAFYATTMRKKIYAIPLGEPLTPDEQTKTKELLLAYMVKPNTVNKNAFLSYRNSLENQNAKKGDIIANFVYKISPKLIGKLA